MKRNILFVDDEPNILQGLRRMLRGMRGEWEMYFVQGVEEALEVLQSIDFDVVISDISMPGRNGFDLLSTMRNMKHTRDIPFLMLTGLNEHGLKRKALDLGATDLLNKPADQEDLVARINNMLRLKSYQDETKTQNELLEQRVKERTAELEAARLDLIWRLGRAAEHRDTDTGNHVMRVGYYCKVLAESIGMDRGFTEMIFLTSPLHDIGKIGIPDNVLLKQGKLSLEECEIMKKHCKIGADILRQDPVKWATLGKWGNKVFRKVLAKSDNPFLKMAATIALNHHERWDGKGYPAGVSGDKIPLESRIVAVADVYDALSSSRPYKPMYSEKKVMKIMRENIGKHFDPEVYTCFDKSLDIFNDIRTQFADEQHEFESGTGMTVRLRRNE